MYRALRWRGYPATDCLRLAYGPQVYVPSVLREAEVVAWIGPYARFMPDEALDLVADALVAEGWRPFDGPVAAQRAFAHWERKNTRRPTTQVS